MFTLGFSLGTARSFSGCYLTQQHPASARIFCTQLSTRNQKVNAPRGPVNYCAGTVNGDCSLKSSTVSLGTLTCCPLVSTCTAVPAPAPTPAPTAAPLPPPAIAPIIAPSAAPPPIRSALCFPRELPATS